MEINGEVVSDIYYYQDMDLSDATRKALDKKGFTQATAIQGGAIPCFMEWKDVVAKAPTGTGKTYAFASPWWSTWTRRPTRSRASPGPHTGAGHPDSG